MTGKASDGVLTGRFPAGRLDGADAFYREHGFLVVEDALGKAEVEAGGAHVRKAGEGGCGDGRADLETFRQEPVAVRTRT